MEETTAWTTIAAERRALADLIDGLDPGQWATPSLCAGWTVRHVTAHLMAGPTGSLVGFLRAMVRACSSTAWTSPSRSASTTAAPQPRGPTRWTSS